MKSRAVFTGKSTAEDTQIAIIEVGGTVGDIESQPFPGVYPSVPA